MSARIPPVAHFVWLGPRLKALGYLALRTALDRGGFETVCLHHDDPALADDPLVRDLIDRPGFALRLVDPEALVTSPEGTLDPAAAERLLHLDRTLASPVIRSDIHRLLHLWHAGGVYLDTDMVTLRPFTPLLGEEGFAGVEEIAVPIEVVDSRNPLVHLRSKALVELRRQLGLRARNPLAAYRRVSGLYVKAINNALMAARPGHPFIGEVLERIAATPDAQVEQLTAIGPHLLQRMTANRSRPGFSLHPPERFYPFPPEICLLLVRDDPEGRFDALLGPETVAVHAYDSVLAKRLHRQPDAAFLRERRHRTLLARLTEPYLDDLFAGRL